MEVKNTNELDVEVISSKQEELTLVAYWAVMGWMGRVLLQNRERALKLERWGDT